MDYYRNLEQNTGIHSSIHSKEKKRSLFYAKKEKLLELNLQGCISNEEFAERNDSLNKAIETLNQELERLKQGKEGQQKNIDEYKELETVLQSKIDSQATNEQIIRSLLNHIIVSKKETEDNVIQLNIFLNYGNMEEGKECHLILKNSYEFKRGYDCSGTKRYKVSYLVHYYSYL